jgi:hypothetical protein
VKVSDPAIKFRELKNLDALFRFNLDLEKFRALFFSRVRAGVLAAMEQRGRNFSTLEKMCLERARLAEKEMKYWMSEAEEWARLKNASPSFADVSATQLDCFLELNNR